MILIVLLIIYETDEKTVSPEFLNTVNKYLEIDDKLKEIRKTIKQLTSYIKYKENFYFKLFTINRRICY